ncbi:8-amino-7-oxononanoate synthase [Alteromonas sp. 14N.309.X.WAT.G.H12]|uniref:8-amino-7-oxononanoate synthase n=1 Tax=Alteromonas sp. 14N.309.X.WAT.G.H12 TaxID=3120824 RepID=UPI002FD121B3
MAFDFISARLQEKHAAGYLRRRSCIEYEKDGIICVDGEHYLNFASNDYLGMRHHEGVLQSWVEGLAQFGGGSGASPLVTGYTQAHAALEGYIESHLQREAVLLFNSGFAANQAICQALLKDDTRVLADKYMHASFLDGALASQAPLRRFGHNDLTHLKSLLAKGTGDCLVASEGVFSMDGDQAPVSELVALCQGNDAWLMLDDAHGFGVLGESGLGTAEHYGLSQQALPVLMGTFGKAVGTAGAFVAGSQALIDYLINEARHYIYSTAMPASQAVATLYSLTAIAAGDERQKLFDNIALFRQLVGQSGLTLGASESAIQPLLTEGPNQALALSKALRTRGIWVPAIRYPTVPKGTDRLRITLSATHSEQDIRVLVDALQLAWGTL